MRRRIVCFTLLAATLTFSNVHAQIALTSQNPAPRKPGSIVRIDLIGDSTQTDNAGYGRGFCANLTTRVDCVNMAKGGASTKTFREQGLWQLSLATKPDYMLIQFGHNDEETPAHLERQTTMTQYEQNLRNFITEARAAGIKPVLVTPITRRYFEDGKIHSDLTPHAVTMERVAVDMQVPLIDLHSESIAYLDRIGELQAQALGITKKDPEGNTIPDKTHLNWEGSYVFGRMVAVDVGKAVPALAKFVKPNTAVLPPVGQLAMRVIKKAPFTIVLVGDSTVATSGGWGPGFCATLIPNVTCLDLAANGRSSKSYIDEGLWKKALAEKGQYYFIQFGHNDQKSDPLRHTDPNTSYSDNLHRFIHSARAVGAIPILVTPLSRRNYRDGQLIIDPLTDYAVAARRVAAEDNVTLLDLYAMSTKLLQGMTQEQADTLDAIAHPDATVENGAAAQPDRTHLNAKGKQLFGRMVADDAARLEVELGPNIEGVPEHPRAPPSPAPAPASSAASPTARFSSKATPNSQGANKLAAMSQNSAASNIAGNLLRPRGRKIEGLRALVTPTQIIRDQTSRNTKRWRNPVYLDQNLLRDGQQFPPRSEVSQLLRAFRDAPRTSDLWRRQHNTAAYISLCSS